MSNNYLIAVFNKNGKNDGLYYSDDLSELQTIKAVHKGCEIQISDIRDARFLSGDLIEKEVQANNVKKMRIGWSFAIRCVETDEVFKSIRVCSIEKNIPYKILYASIRNHAGIKGFHYVFEDLKGDGDGSIRK